MNYFSIRTNDQNTIKKILESEKTISVSRLSWHKDDVNINDIVLLVISGDSAKKSFNYENGLRAIGKVNKLPYNDDEPRHFKIDIEITLVLPKSVTKKELYVYPVLMDCPNIGAETKTAPNQAFRMIEKEQACAVFSALSDVLPELADSIFKLNENNPISVKKYKLDVTPPPDILESSLKQFDTNNFLWILSTLQSKPFLILTGLSGSGKTLQALSLVKWITSKKSLSFFKKLDAALNSEKILENYVVYSISTQTVELINKNGGSGKIIPLPLAVIEEWYLALKNGLIKAEDDPKDTRHIVGETSAYQKYIHGFYNDLKKVALALLEQNEHEESESEPESSQYILISVGADWTSNENLLGYPDALKEKSYRKPDNGALALILAAQADPENPYFLILDEMNLSHVERYFADFLSAMESGEAMQLHSGKKGELWNGVPSELKIPKNLFVIGTVNVDETTYMFSPKVLDRANVIEFRVSDDEMASFLQNPVKPDLEAIAGQGAGYGKAFVAAAQKDVSLDEELRGQISAVLMTFFPELQKAGAEFGYRSAHEICRFVYFHQDLSGDDWDFDSAMDAAIMQKLLPKLHGSKKKLVPVLASLIRLSMKESVIKDLTNPLKDDILIEGNAKYPVSIAKLKRMRQRLAEHGFTSFAEA